MQDFIPNAILWTLALYGLIEIAKTIRYYFACTKFKQDGIYLIIAAKNQEELHDLKVVKRKEVAEKIKEAREQGDLSENAEYDAAKDEQRDIEARIEEIEKILKNAEVVVEDEVDLDKISVGCKVKVHDFEFEEDIELKIVGSTEANSLEGKISNESPVGKALIGAHTGDVVEVEMPAGIMKYKVLEIQRNV